MKLARLGDARAEIPVVRHDDQWWDLRPITDDIDGSFLEGDWRSAIDSAIADGRLTPLADADSLRVGAPIARPGAVICIGMNYAKHAAESGAEPPSSPVVFLKLPNTVVGPYDDVPIPRGSTKTDWEVELGVVIGRVASYLSSPEESRAHVAGYVVANDVSERAFQLEQSGGQWSKGKCAPAFTPLGPWLVTPDEVEPPRLSLRSHVNGDPRQDSSTADMLFDVDFVIWHLSQYMTLDPGDLVLTGTPEGVALSGRFDYLRAGDVVRCEIEGLGAQEQRMVDPV